MMLRILSTAFLSWTGSILSASAHPQSNTPCNAFTDEGIQMPNLTVIHITTLESRNLTISATPPFLPTSVEGLDICQVVVTYNHPDARTPVNLTLFLSLSEWTGRFLGIGGSGFAAGIPITMAPFAKLGYATASTDAGLPGGGNPASPADWALLPDGSVNMELLENFASRSVHDLAVLGPAAIQHFYGRRPVNSYWSGCSTSGRQALMAAQRYLDDFDGFAGRCGGLGRKRESAG